jgi:DNA-binding LytR/AlgR family response regulator
MTVGTLIVDDMLLARKRLARHLATDRDVEIVGECSGGQDAIDAIRRLAPDLVFLDVQMPEIGGFEVLEAVGAHAVPVVVFVTAYDQFAVAAFEEGAVDYVMKPVSARRIAMAVDRVKARMSSAPARLESLLEQLSRIPRHSGQYLRWINASRGEDVQLITTDEVRYFQSDTKYTRVVAARREGLIRKTIKQLAQELDPELFWQIHRATIVNLDAIERVTRDLRGNVVLRLKDREEVLQVSQPFAHLFRQM